MVAAATIGGAVIGGVASNMAADTSADAAKDAANTQANSEAQSRALQKEQYDQTRADYAPYREAGNSALSKLRYLSGDKSQPAYDWQTDPGYAFRLSEGEKGINRAAAARGGFNSGATLKALSRFNSNLADQEYGSAWNRLASMAGIGQTATGQLGQLGSAYATNMGNSITGAGNAMAAGQIGAANARASGYQGIAGSLAGAYKNYQDQQLIDKLGNQWGNGSSFGNSYQPQYDYGGNSYGGGDYSGSMIG